MHQRSGQWQRVCPAICDPRYPVRHAPENNWYNEYNSYNTHKNNNVYKVYNSQLHSVLVGIKTNAHQIKTAQLSAD